MTHRWKRQAVPALLTFIVGAVLFWQPLVNARAASHHVVKVAKGDTARISKPSMYVQRWFMGALPPRADQLGTQTCPSMLLNNTLGPHDTRTEKDPRPHIGEECIYPDITITPDRNPVSKGEYNHSHVVVHNAHLGCVTSSNDGSLGGWSVPQVDGNGNIDANPQVGPYNLDPTLLIIDCYNFNGANAEYYITITVQGGGGPPPGCQDNEQENTEFMGGTEPPASVMPGQQFAVSLTFKNTGPCPWTRAAMFRLGSQNWENNDNWNVVRVYLEDFESIQPGQTKTFIVYATAPTTCGVYGWGWRMVHEYIRWFGSEVQHRDITVTCPTPPTAAMTPDKQMMWSDETTTISWNCTNSTQAIASGNWSGEKPLQGSMRVGPLMPYDYYTYKITCKGDYGTASATSKIAVADADPSILASLDTPAQEQTLSWNKVSNIKCKSHYKANEGWWHPPGLPGHLEVLKIRVAHALAYCYNTQTHLLACGPQACPIYRQLYHTNPGIPWDWDSWDYGSCESATCRTYGHLGASSAKIWMQGNLKTCFVFKWGPLCRSKQIGVRSTVYANGQTPYDELLGP